MFLVNPVIATCPKCKVSNVLICVKCGLCAICSNHHNCQNSENNKIIDNKYDNLVFVEAGNIILNYGLNLSAENRESIRLTDFYMGKYPVTQKEWKEVIPLNPSWFKGDNLPVENVSWYHILVFLNKFSLKEGLRPVYKIKNSTNPDDWGSVPDERDSTWDSVTYNLEADGYRLPTEAEWEYASRGGNLTNSYHYSGSDILDDVAWYGRNSNGKTHEVGQKKPNELDIYDMTGNVWEWCWDWFKSYTDEYIHELHGPSKGKDKVRRGGSWGYYDHDNIFASRSSNAPTERNRDLGFRIAKNK